jgi:hypothetical protein
MAKKNSKKLENPQKKRERCPPVRPVEPRSTPALQKFTLGTRLLLPVGEPDLETLRSVTREWLVPRLVEKFLRMHDVERKHLPKFTNSDKSATAPNRRKAGVHVHECVSENQNASE